MDKITDNFTSYFKKLILQSFCNLEHLSYSSEDIQAAVDCDCILNFESYKELLVVNNALDVVNYVCKLDFNKVLITSALYCKLNEIITLGSLDQELYGKYRKVEVTMKALGVLPPPKNKEVDILVDSLNDFDKIADPKDCVINTMLKLMKMQPFENGNKRTALMLANCALIKQNDGIIYFDNTNYPEFKERLSDYYVTGNTDVVNYLKSHCMSY